VTGRSGCLADYLDRLPRRITNALNEVTSLTYDAANRQITSITRPTGLITTNSYFTTGFHKNYLQQTRDYAGAAEFGTYQFTYTNGMVRTLTVTHFFLIVLFSNLAPQGFWPGGRTGVVSCSRITALGSYAYDGVGQAE
jgi:YD repeat-containing protein